ncbi:response regulator [Granulosicoccaceae sp. 1_MG-2023]|nr:response regulator [Granulosicoccaceae sp. 1_MG-2023]
MSLKVALIEDSAILRELLCEMLHEIDDVSVCFTVDCEEEALTRLQAEQVDLAIVDLELREGNGLGVIRRMKAEPETFGTPKTVVFSNYAVSPMSRRCAQMGVDRIYDKSFQLHEMLDYVRATLSGLQPAKPV